MTSVSSQPHEHSAPRTQTGDLFNSPLVWFVLVLMVLLTLGTVAAIGAIYYGDDIARPSWNERAPAP